MIRLSKRNWWVRMAYTMRDEWGIPERTNICSLFWRGVLVLSAECSAAVLVGYVIARAVVYYEVVLALGALVALGGVVLCFVFGAAWFVARVSRVGQRSYRAITETVPAQAFKSWKERHCALVRIED